MSQTSPQSPETDSVKRPQQDSLRGLPRRKRVSPPSSRPIDQITNDLAGLERLHEMQARLIQELRKQIANLQREE